MTVFVIKPGLQTTVQSGPRTGLRHIGVPASGAADPLSLALANKLVGNAWDTPALETTLLGPVLEFDVGCTLAITGAESKLTLNGQSLELHHVFDVRPGDRLEVGAADRGARKYIAFSGGLAAEHVLGSASTYLPAGFGGFVSCLGIGAG